MEVAYTYRYTSGHLIPKAEIGINNVGLHCFPTFYFYDPK